MAKAANKPAFQLLFHTRACLLWLLALAAGATSCVSNKQLVYFQDQAIKRQQVVQFNNQKPTYRIQSGDILNIQVKGVDQEISNMFNTTTAIINFNDPVNQFMVGYSVDETGDIKMPTAGKVQVRGLTVPEATDLVQQRINNYLKGAVIILKLVSFKITVLGEVKRPGQYFIANNQATVLEGIGIGGDLTNVANRRRIKLFRQTPQGTEVTLIDLTDSKLIRSPYYYLQPNDVLYVEPLSGQTPRANLAPITLSLGILTGLVTTFLLIDRLNNNGN